MDTDWHTMKLMIDDFQRFQGYYIKYNSWYFILFFLFLFFLVCLCLFAFCFVFLKKNLHVSYFLFVLVFGFLCQLYESYKQIVRIIQKNIRIAFFCVFVRQFCWLDSRNYTFHFCFIFVCAWQLCYLCWFYFTNANKIL